MAPTAHFPDPGKRKKSKADWIPFEIGDDLFHLVMPKTYDIAQIAIATETGGGLNDPANMRTMLQFAGRIVRYIVEEPPAPDGSPRGRALILSRLDDVDDNFDLENLIPTVMQLTRGYLERPTGSPRASSAPRRQASPGPASAARTRSTTAKTSTRSSRSST